MFDLGVPELLLILLVVVVIFGPSRLTEVMGALGKGIREFRTATRESEAKNTDSKNDGKDAP